MPELLLALLIAWAFVLLAFALLVVLAVVLDVLHTRRNRATRHTYTTPTFSYRQPADRRRVIIGHDHDTVRRHLAPLGNVDRRERRHG